MGQGTSPLQVHRAAPYALGELSNTNICSFQGSFEPIFSTQFFHTSLDTTYVFTLLLLFSFSSSPAGLFCKFPLSSLPVYGFHSVPEPFPKIPLSVPAPFPESFSAVMSKPPFSEALPFSDLYLQKDFSFHIPVLLSRLQWKGL